MHMSGWILFHINEINISEDAAVVALVTFLTC